MSSTSFSLFSLLPCIKQHRTLSHRLMKLTSFLLCENRHKRLQRLSHLSQLGSRIFLSYIIHLCLHQFFDNVDSASKQAFGLYSATNTFTSNLQRFSYKIRFTGSWPNQWRSDKIRQLTEIRQLNKADSKCCHNQVNHTAVNVNLECFWPGRFRTRSLRILNNRIQFLLEQYEDAVHDTHDEVRRLRQLPHRRNVSSFDGL